jgi:hypothetical protein
MGNVLGVYRRLQRPIRQVAGQGKKSGDQKLVEYFCRIFFYDIHGIQTSGVLRHNMLL